jgi:hypothetical protein
MSTTLPLSETAAESAALPPAPLNLAVKDSIWNDAP